MLSAAAIKSNTLLIRDKILHLTTHNVDAFYMYHRLFIKCGSEFLIFSAVTGISISLIMMTASSIIQKNRSRLLSLSKSLGDTKDTSLYFKIHHSELDATTTDQQEEKKTNNNNKKVSSKASPTARSLQVQYNQLLASLKKSWLFRVIDEHAKDGDKFGRNVFNELLEAYYSSFYSSSSSSSSPLTMTTVSSSSSSLSPTAATSSSSSSSMIDEDDISLLKENGSRSDISDKSHNFLRTRLIMSSVTKYFFTRFIARALWAVSWIGVERVLSRILFSSSSSENHGLMMSQEFIEGLNQLSSFNNQQEERGFDEGNIPSTSSSSIVTINAMLELSVHTDFYYFGISRFSALKKLSVYLIRGFYCQGCPAFNLGEAESQAFVHTLIKEKAGFADVVIYRVMNSICEDVCTVSIRVVDIIRQCFFSASKRVDNNLTYELNHHRDQQQQQQKTNNTHHQAQHEKQQQPQHLFDEKGSVMASINPNAIANGDENEQNNNNNNNISNKKVSFSAAPSSSSSTKKAATSSLTTSRVPTLTRRERVSLFFSKMKTLMVFEVARTLIPKRTKQFVGAAASTFVLTKLVGEKRISWYTSAAICFAFWF